MATLSLKPLGRLVLLAVVLAAGCSGSAPPTVDEAEMAAHMEKVNQEEEAQNKVRQAEEKELAKKRPRGE